jgi:sporulation integral membrane protein YlbJ
MFKLSSSSRTVTLLLGAAAAALVILIVLYPERAFQSSLKGLSIWWDIIFPALLPFFVLTEILTASGVLRFIGVWLEPAMRLLFRVPGAGGWAIAAGFAAGFPAGSQAVRTLRQNRSISRSEGERLLAISHFGSPVLIFSVIAVGFLHDPGIGVILIVIHVISAFVTGIVMRWHNAPEVEVPSGGARFNPDHSPSYGFKSLFTRSLREMHKAHEEDGRTFGKLLGDAVMSSVQTLMMIGGYMMIFSVILNTLDLSHISRLMNFTLTLLLSPFHVPADIIQRAAAGIFEAHLGMYAVGLAQTAPASIKAALIGAILAWGGLSVHAQVKSIIHSTDLRYFPFFISRLFHAVCAFTLTLVLWRPLQPWLGKTAPAFTPFDGNAAGPSVELLPHPFDFIQYTITLSLGSLGVLLTASLIIYLARPLYRTWR